MPDNINKRESNDAPALVLLTGDGIPPHFVKNVITEWDKTSVNTTVVGNGIHRLTPPPVLEALSSCIPTTFLHYLGHSDGEDLQLFYINDHNEETLIPMTCRKTLKIHKEVPAVRQLWGCHLGNALSEVEVLGEGQPLIIHAGKKYQTVLSITADAIAKQAAFYESVLKLYGRAPNAYDVVEYSILTSPETVYVAEIIKGKKQAYKISAPKSAEDIASLQETLAKTLAAFRQFRIDNLGHDEQNFLDFSEKALGVTTPEVRAHYMEAALVMESSRASKHSVTYVKSYLKAANRKPDDPYLNDDWTLLFHASCNKDKALVQALLEAGADPKRVDKKNLKATNVTSDSGIKELLHEYEVRRGKPSSFSARLPSKSEVSIFNEGYITQYYYEKSQKQRSPLTAAFN